MGSRNFGCSCVMNQVHCKSWCQLLLLPPLQTRAISKWHHSGDAGCGTATLTATSCETGVGMNGKKLQPNGVETPYGAFLVQPWWVTLLHLQAGMEALPWLQSLS